MITLKLNNVDFTIPTKDLQKDIVDPLLEKVSNDAEVNRKTADRFPLSPSAATKPNIDLYLALKNHYHPNSIPEEPLDGRVVMLLRLGHDIESHLVKFIRKGLNVVATNERVTYGALTNGPTLTGEFDFIIEHNGEKILCDSKSIADYLFKTTPLPKQEHIVQLNLYLHSDYCRKNAINKAWVWYYCKNNSELKVKEFQYNQALAEAALQKFQYVYDCYLNNTPPPIEYVLGADYQADYSAFRKYIFRDFTGDYKEIELDVDGRLCEMHDYKEKLRYVVLNFGPKKVKDGKGKIYWAELGGPKGMLLKSKDEGSDYVFG